MQLTFTDLRIELRRAANQLRYAERLQCEKMTQNLWNTDSVSRLGLRYLALLLLIATYEE